MAKQSFFQWLLADFNWEKKRRKARLQNIPTDHVYSKRNKPKTDLFDLVAYYQDGEVKTTQTGAKVLNDLMIPGTTSINQ